MHKIMKTVFGSHLYGLSNPNSDTDFKGVYLPTLEELLLNSYKPRINLDTNKDGKNSAGDVDMEWIALPTFLQMAVKGESEALDMLHSSNWGNMGYGYIWEDLISKRDKFYTKGLKAYMGMLNGQVNKNGNKGKKLSLIKSLIDMLKHRDPDERLRDIWGILPTGKYMKKGANDIKLGRTDAERFWEVVGSKYQESIKIGYCIEQLQLKVDNYGHRARKAEENGGYDWKAISHALRVGYQLVDIYECGTFSYPLSQTDYLLAVKAGELDYDTVVKNELELLLAEVEALSEASAMPERTDKAYWDKWLLNVYNNEFTLGELW